MPAAAGVETFNVPAIGLFFAAAPEVFRVVDVLRTGVFLIFISGGDPPVSGGT